MIVALVAAGRASASRRTATRSSATCWTRWSRRRRKRGVTVRIGQKPAAKRGDEPTCAAARSAIATTATSARRAGRRRARRGRRHGLGLVAAASSRASLDVLFVDEAGQMSLANVLAVSPAAALPGPARRPAAAGPAAPGLASARRRGVRAGAPARRARDDAAEWLGLFLEQTWRLHPDLRASRRKLFYEGRLESEPATAAPGARAAPGTSAARASAGSRSRTCGAGQRVARRRRPDRGARPARSSAHHGPTAMGGRRPIGWDDILIVAPYNAQVARSRSACRGPGSARSTSSRARRRPSRSTR